MILLLDNYDSFTFNLVHYLGELGAACDVRRNDALSVGEAMGLRPDAVVVSPGPGAPDSAGIAMELVLRAAGEIPVLGVCLGHQAIGQAFGGEIVPARSILHGKTGVVRHRNDRLFEGVPAAFEVTRYHSLAVRRSTLPECLEVTAEAEDGEIMAIRHREHAVFGVQFHPESIATEHGKTVLQNFLRLLVPSR